MQGHKNFDVYMTLQGTRAVKIFAVVVLFRILCSCKIFKTGNGITVKLHSIVQKLLPSHIGFTGLKELI